MDSRNLNDNISKTIQLALAGGGSLGAYQCGALEVLIPFWKSRGYKITSGTGVSAGAVNIALVAYLVNTGQEDKVSQILGGFWDTNGQIGDRALSTAWIANDFLDPFQIFPRSDHHFPNLPGYLKYVFNWTAASGMPLKKLHDLLEDFIPREGWKAIQNGPMHTVIKTIEVNHKTGKRQSVDFINSEINADTLVASAAMRDFGRYNIGDHYYEDGGYEKIGFLIKDQPCDVLFAIDLRPLKDPSVVEDARGVKTGSLQYDLAEFYEDPARVCHIDFLCLDHEPHWNDTCAMNNSSRFINELRQRGRRAAEAFIARNGASFGLESHYKPHPAHVEKIYTARLIPQAA